LKPLLILEDRSLSGAVEGSSATKRPREWALTQVNKKFQELFDAIQGRLFRQRKSDVSDVLGRVYVTWKPEEESVEERRGQKASASPTELLPSEAAVKLVAGASWPCMDMGGATSPHRHPGAALNIPSVVGLRNITQPVRPAIRSSCDGTDGEVIITPPPAVGRIPGKEGEVRQVLQ